MQNQKEGWAKYADWLGKYNKRFPSDPKEGEYWFVRIVNAVCVTKVRIGDITERTVVLEEINGWSKPRYIRTDIEFVEKA